MASVPTGTVRLRRGAESLQDSAPGKRGVGAPIKAIGRVLHQSGHLVEYQVQATSGGKDALGEVTVKCDFGGDRLVTGKGASTDVIGASARAYLNAVNRFRQQSKEPKNVSQSENLEPAGC